MSRDSLAHAMDEAQRASYVEGWHWGWVSGLLSGILIGCLALVAINASFACGTLWP